MLRMMIDRSDSYLCISIPPFFFFINDQSRTIVSIVKEFYRSPGKYQTEVDKLIDGNENFER